MSAWRAARPEEVRRLWPAARAVHLAASLAGFESEHRDAAWRVQVSDAGDVMVLKLWRSHLDILAMRAVWAPSHRIGWAVERAREVAAGHSYERLLSPLVSMSTLAPYIESGMTVAERVVAFQATPYTVLRSERPAMARSLRPATAADLEALVELDAACFDDFWRQGRPEFEHILAAEDVTVCEQDAAIIGYSSCSVAGATATLGRLAVEPNARRAGVARALVLAAAQAASRRGALGISLCTQEANAASQALYSGLGFVEVGERYAMASCPTGAQPLG